MNPDLNKLCTELAQWFDFQLRHRSNFETSVILCTDFMLMSGISIMKILWSPLENGLCFDPIEPYMLIVPDSTQDLAKADWIVHIQHMTPWQYRHGPGHELRQQGDDFIASITGKGVDTAQSGEATEREYTKAEREGLTYGTEDCIVIWQVFCKTAAGVQVTEYSPVRPDDPIRETFILPYEHGKYPFVDFRSELKAKQFYDSRGICEILAPFEAQLNFSWNGKNDSMSLFNKPLFKADQDVPNTGNLRFEPGQILPRGVQPAQFPAPPISYDEEMAKTRGVAEYRIGMPDFGIGNPLDKRSDRKTATEVDAVQQMGGTIADMRGRIFRKSLTRIYEQAWELLKQYGKGEKSLLSFIQDSESRTLTPEALTEAFTIIPSGANDSWNTQARLDKAIMRKQLFAQSPWIDQEELDKQIVELDDPALIKRLFIKPGGQAMRQYKAQLEEMAVLTAGFPLEPDAQDDDTQHLKAIIDWIQTVPPQTMDQGAALQQHIQLHMQRLQQTNSKAASELAQMLQQAMQTVMMQMQGQGQMLPQPQQGGMPL